jgi:hypothetical protein
VLPQVLELADRLAFGSAQELGQAQRMPSDRLRVLVQVQVRVLVQVQVRVWVRELALAKVSVRV